MSGCNPPFKAKVVVNCISIIKVKLLPIPIPNCAPTPPLTFLEHKETAINTKIKAKPAIVEPSNPDLFSYPYIHMTGHGNVVFSANDVINLRNYLTSVILKPCSFRPYFHCTYAKTW